MANHYVITRLINNNVVFSLDQAGNEIIVFGKAIGFKKKRGDLIDEERIIKVFADCDAKSRNYLVNLVEDIRPEYIDLAARIIALFEKKLQVKVNDMMHVSLSDHLSNAVANKKEGFDVPLDILKEIQSIYPREFLTAKEGLRLVRETTGVELCEDEAGFIVLHYINAQGKNFRSDAKFRLLFQEKIIEDIETCLQMRLERSSLYYTRFLTHLSFLAARIHDQELLNENNSAIYRLIIDKYPQVEACVEKSAQTINDEFNLRITDEEKGYLAIHIKNMIQALKRKEIKNETDS